MSDFPDRLVRLVWFRSSATKTVTVGLLSQGVGRLASRDLSKFLSLAQVGPFPLQADPGDSSGCQGLDR